MCLPIIILGLLIFLAVCFGVCFALLVMDCKEEDERERIYYRGVKTDRGNYC